jgi:hypothetical protein
VLERIEYSRMAMADQDRVKYLENELEVYRQTNRQLNETVAALVQHIKDLERDLKEARSSRG